MVKDLQELLMQEEIGEAKLLMSKLHGKVTFDYQEHKWYTWTGSVWSSIGSGEVVERVSEITDYLEIRLMTLDSTYQPLKDAIKRRIHALNKVQRRLNIVRALEMLYPQKQQGAIDWDQTRMLLPVANGVVDLTTGKLRTHSHDHMLRAISSTVYRGLQVTAPTWDRFLLDIMDGDSDMVGFLQRLIGYAITGDNSEHIFPVMWGRGRNGKGTLMETVGRILGSLAAPVSASLLMESTYSRGSSSPSPDLLALLGKKVVWANETEEGRRLSTATVKWLCGGDKIAARGLYAKEETSFYPTHTLFLLTNHRPVVSPDDYALWERVKLIPFTLSYTDRPRELWERKKNPHLFHRFEVEDQGILAWMVRGAVDWHHNGLRPPALLEDSAAEYQSEMDNVRRFIVDDCEVDVEFTTRAQVIYNHYRLWCRKQGITTPMTQSKFGRRFTKRFPKHRRGSGYLYLGVRPKVEGVSLNPKDGEEW